MTIRFVLALGCVCMLFSGISFGQIVSFNDPVSWSTQRNDSLIVKVQLDTAQLKGKSIEFSVAMVRNGRSKNMATKSFVADDVTKELFLGTTTETIVGGKDFLHFEWKVPGATDKGECAPVGLVNILKVEAKDTIVAKRITSAIDLNTLKNMASPLIFYKIGSMEVAFVWNDNVVGIVCKKNPTTGETIQFALDGKNARSAFIAYSDFFLKYVAATDSVSASFFQRSLTESILSYAEKPYASSLVCTATADLSLIVIPWHDLKMIPLTDPKATKEGRVSGFAMFCTDKNSSLKDSWPTKAITALPGTWGNIRFALK